MITDAPSDAPAHQGSGDAAGLSRGDDAAGTGSAGDVDDSPSPHKPRNKVVLVTGMSGAGKTVTLKALEDLGYEAVDNLPLSLLGAVIRPGEQARRPLALGIDIRTRDFGVTTMLAEMDRLRQAGDLEMTLVFMDCDDEVLGRRFTETRRRHPLAVDRPLSDGIRHERELVTPLLCRSEVVIDTTSLPPGELKRVLSGHFGLNAKPALVVFVTSFSYRRGLPREADLVFDARFLSNPHYDPALRPLTGRDERVAAHVEGDPGFEQFFKALTDLLCPLLPRFAAEGKSYLTIAIGCTGGRHRSVVIAEKLTRWLREQDQRVDLRHRELEEGE